MSPSEAAPAVTPLLRPYQREAISRLHEMLGRGVRRVLIALPTGGGKTVIASDIVLGAVAAGRRVLFIAHRRELIHQAYERFRAYGLREIDIGVIMANDRRRLPPAPVQIASIQTLRNLPNLPPADIVFIDEAHLSLSKSYVECALAYPNAVHLGLTATPYRGDGRGLGDAYDELLVVASPAELMKLGYLVEPRVYTAAPGSLPNLARVRIKGGDYHEGELARVMDNRELVGNIVEHWEKHAGGERTVAFAVSVEHSQHITERFRSAGIAAEHVDGTTPLDERAAIIARWASGQTRVVSNCGIFCEGFDLPAIKCAILARPTKSLGLYLQQAGRILRPWNGVEAVILDHAGCALTHGLPQEDRVFTLDTSKPAGEKGPAPVKICEQCRAALPTATRICPHCGWEFPAPPSVPDETGAELVQVTPLDRTSLTEMRKLWDELCQTVADRNYKPGWAFIQFKKVFFRAPPRHFPPAVNFATPSARARIAGDIVSDVEQGRETLAWARATYQSRVGAPPPPGVLEQAALVAERRRPVAASR